MHYLSCYSPPNEPSIIVKFDIVTTQTPLYKLKPLTPSQMLACRGKEVDMSMRSLTMAFRRTNTRKHILLQTQQASQHRSQADCHQQC